MINFLDYIQLFKFRYHISFILVILGSLIFNTTQPIWSVAISLLVVYFSFNVLLYSGLYILNDIADFESDSRHPQKRHRPLPSKRVNISSAYALSLSFIALGLMIAYFYFGKFILAVYILFMCVNFFYTHIAKKVPYLEILVNSITYPMRFFLGISLVVNQAPYFLLFAILLLACGFACMRRIIEKRMPGWEARRVLKYYTETKLLAFQTVLFFLIVVILIIDYPLYLQWHIIILVVYFISISGIHFSDHFNDFYQWLFLG